MIGRNWDLFVPRDRFPAVWVEHARLISEGEPRRYENPILTKSGEERMIVWRNSQLHDQAGAMVNTVSFGIDMTDEMRAKEQREQSLQLLSESDEQRRRLLKRLVQAQETERRQVAGEIHDDPVQVLTALALRLDVVAKSIDDPQVLAELADARQTAYAALTSLRHLIFELHPLVLDRQGLVVALEVLLEQTRQETGLQVRLESTLARTLSAETSAIAYRIAQEALLNIRKHARALQITVHVDQTADALVVRIKDDGLGFDPGAHEPGGLGLISMRERAEMAGGRFAIESVAERGTTVTFSLPLAT